LFPTPALLGDFPHFQVFAPNDLFPTLVPLGIFPLFREFAPTSLLPTPIHILKTQNKTSIYVALFN
jgi:hypothetical protein